MGPMTILLSILGNRLLFNTHRMEELDSEQLYSDDQTGRLDHGRMGRINTTAEMSDIVFGPGVTSIDVGEDGAGCETRFERESDPSSGRVGRDLVAGVIVVPR